MSSIKTAGEAVARIAHLASDVVVSVVPTLASESEFSEALKSLQKNNATSIVAKGQTELITVRQNADPLLSVFQPIRAGKLTSVTTTSSILVKSIPHLYKLAQYPVVLHVSVQPSGFPDFSDITSIRNSGFTFIQSETLQEAQDLALTAHALAVKSGKGVIHFFDSGAYAFKKEIDYEDAELARKVLDLDTVASFQRTKSEETTLYADDGRSATLSLARSQAANIGSEPAPLSSSEHGRSLPVSERTSERADSSSGSSQRDASTSGASVSSATTVESLVSKPISSEDIYRFATQIWGTIRDATGRSYDAFAYTGSGQEEAAIFLFGADTGLFATELDTVEDGEEYANTGIITARLYRPWLGASLAHLLPRSLKRIAVLEQVRRKTTKWGPLLLDLLMSMKSTGGASPIIVGYQLGYINEETVQQALRGVHQNLMSETPVQNLQIGNMDGPEPQSTKPEQPALENAYMKILNQVFGDKLHIANQLGSQHAGVSNELAASPEYGFGSLVARKEHRKRFVDEAAAASKDNAFTTSAPQQWLSKWALSAEDTDKANEYAPEVISRLSTDGSPAANQLLASKKLFYKESPWLVGSDAWAYDLGNSGVHHVLASSENVNMLIVDSTPYSERTAADAERRKKDIGLYAMNFGNAYVASVAVYSSYTQVLEAMIEADKFDGPSVVLAYLPYEKENDSPLTVLQETKKAVDLGYWPLYRWDPRGDDKGEPNFTLDSERIKKELEEFLARDNYMSQVMKRHPEFSSHISGSYGTEVRQLQKRKAKDAYSKLLEGLQGDPMTVLFASDNGNSENLAKRLANRGKARGLKTMVMAMDDFPLEDLPNEQNVVLFTSVAGQGEFPQNGRTFWETVKDSTDLDLATINFAVFGLGDSHYWPRKEDKIYYNKPAKDLHARLLTLGGTPLVECGLGDDQDPDAYQTAYAEWEPKLWQKLGVDNVEGLPEEPAPLTNEDMKAASNFLRGTIEEGLNDTSTGAISASDQQLTKFHGTYMQDDRDLRDERKAQGLEPAYSFMIRCRLAGGVATPKQWLQMDEIATKLGNETMKLTTRQTFQFHGVVKGKLKPAMQAINKSLMTTIAACGDVNRNVMCSVLPTQSKYHSQVHEASQRISDHLLPSTSAYHEIWLEDDETKQKRKIAGEAVQDHEPLYGPLYLPRKFKITIAIPPHNDTDVYAHDIGLIAIKGEDGNLKGFNLLAGGGMGVTHNNKKTYPRTGSMFGYVSNEDVHIACEKIMLVQRDHGDRKNRKHARLKYTIDDMGIDVFRGKVEELWGQKFADPKPFKFESNVDTFGWQKDENGLSHFTFFIENGRIEDTADFPMKTGLIEVAKAHKGEFRLTGNQHLVLSNVAEEDLPAMKELLKKWKLDNTNFSAMRLSSSACVAFPTCGLAMAESERYLPELITKLEGTLEENGLRQESIVMRMTGCPNGCARPWLAEVAFVGKAYGAYNMYLGGGYHGQRLNKLYRSSIKEDEILEIMKPMIKQYATERNEGEHFGDFVIRKGYINETTHGTNFHDNTAEEESDGE
ncbi:assimilatory sulfite reductase [Parastagonospora nodorum]|nr:assimilatory sulfite reductase [Parastagonospora nodorum]KAH5183167.1 assimilatory sulfite reductase [Parastagonospora nodorum]KAH5429465.1 assimilatory sulfite reductase [Parastagonospora nodorum]KAH6081980.1 assimilatory sulfite reductase [Parastagonospora nodorum]KAH6221262.1 assimilatory sulfite reductase [Parastagonospora nodorum]